MWTAIADSLTQPAAATKSESRNPKSETNSKLEIQMFKTNPSTCRVLDFGPLDLVSYFVLRISYFPHAHMRILRTNV